MKSKKSANKWRRDCDIVEYKTVIVFKLSNGPSTSPLFSPIRPHIIQTFYISESILKQVSDRLTFVNHEHPAINAAGDASK